MIVLKRLYSKQAGSVKFLRKSKKDPGIYQQKKILEESGEIENTDFDELESDFMNVHKSHREHLEEIETQKEREKYLIVKQKYFKEKFPNFLTWHDKEQIQYLHNNYPEEWSIERLSEGFPALPDVIEQIIKGKWTKNKNKISNHDKGVVQNWIHFRQGKLNNLPQELKEHLRTFSNRKLNFEPFEKSGGKAIITQGDQKKTTCGEFSEIIASYQRLKGKNADKPELIDQNLEYRSFTNSDENTKSRFKVKNKNVLLTFKELQDTVEKKISRGQNISLQDKLLIEANLPKKDVITTIELSQEVSNIVENRRDVHNDKVGFVQKTVKDMSHLIYPEKIVIPEEIYKKGYTYKLNDCYYASDGEFLYRVPGMG